jgi:hypothetical protein
MNDGFRHREGDNDRFSGQSFCFVSFLFLSVCQLIVF